MFNQNKPPRPNVQTKTDQIMKVENPNADIMRYLVKHHSTITDVQWQHIRAILELKDNLFPERAYTDCPQFDLAEVSRVPLKMQASVAHDYVNAFFGVIERQMGLKRPNWAVWLTEWLDNLKPQ